MKKSSLYFTGPEKLDVKREEIENPNSGEVLVETEISGISSGTEMLFYKNKIGKGVKIDKEIKSLQQETKYPFKYGYSTVGHVKEIGNNVSEDWRDQLVFSFHPHESRFLSSTEDLIKVPADIRGRKAIFLPSLETAINLIMDGRPVIGENIVIIGQGVIGLLITSVLSEMAFNRVYTTEKSPKKRNISEDMGASESLEANISKEDFIDSTDLPEEGADLTYEVSGNPKALKQAIHITRFSGRVIVGSWYGDKDPIVSLDSDFHRNRVDLISSQVSSIDPSYSGRWDKKRRTNLAWRILKKLDLEKLITHEFPLKKAKKAYSRIDQENEDTVQVIFNYN